jgi:hypothetical protein
MIGNSDAAVNVHPRVAAAAIRRRLPYNLQR